MTRIVQFRRGTSSGLSTILGAPGELFVDTSLSTVVVHDGVTTGGTTLATQSYAQSAAPTATSSVQGKVRPNNTSITVNAGVISLGSSITTNWTMQETAAGALYFYYNGVAKFRFDSSGTIAAVSNIGAFITI
jgi:hypothetical protein